MTPSTRTPSKKQVQVLFVVARDRLATTEAVHQFRENGIKSAGLREEKQRDTFALLNTCDRYEWLEVAVTDEAARAASPNDGAGKSWTITAAGAEALERGQAELQRQKEKDQMGTTTEEPPKTEPAWGGGGTTTTPEPPAPPAEEDAASEPSEDEETVPAEDVEIEEPPAEEPATKENHVVEGSNQLTMLVVPKGSRLKPKQFTLAMRSRQQEFGTTREYLLGERVYFEGYIEVDEVRTKVKKDGSVVKIASAKIAECNLLDEAPE